MNRSYTLPWVGMLLIVSGCGSSTPDASNGSSSGGSSGTSTGGASGMSSGGSSGAPTGGASGISSGGSSGASTGGAPGMSTCVNIQSNTTSFIKFGLLNQAPAIPLPPGALPSPLTKGTGPSLSAPVIQPVVNDSTTVYASYYELDCPAGHIAREDFETSGPDFEYHQYDFFNAKGEFVTNQASLSSFTISGTGAYKVTTGFILGAVGGWRDAGSHYAVAVSQRGTTTDHTTQKTEVVYGEDLAWQEVSNSARNPALGGQNIDGDFTVTVFKVPDQPFADWFISTFGSPRTAAKPTPDTIGSYMYAPTNSSTALTFKYHRQGVYIGALDKQNAHVEFSADPTSAQVWPQVAGATYTFKSDPVDESFKLFTRPDPAKGDVWPIHAWVQDNKGTHIAELYYNLYGNGYLIWQGVKYATFGWNLAGPDQLALALPNQ